MIIFSKTSQGEICRKSLTCASFTVWVPELEFVLNVVCDNTKYTWNKEHKEEKNDEIFRKQEVKWKTSSKFFKTIRTGP